MTLATDTSGDNLFHSYLVDIEIAGTTYYMTDMYKEFTYNSNTYTPLGELLGVSSIRHSLNPSDQAVNVVVSGLGGSRDFKSLALSSRSKGGNVTIYRGLSPTSSQDIIANSKIYTVFKGFIKNINFAEEFPMGSMDVRDSVIFDCSNFWSLRKDTSKGRKTNPDSFNAYARSLGAKRFTRVMDRVSALNGKKFAFGRAG